MHDSLELEAAIQRCLKRPLKFFAVGARYIGTEYTEEVFRAKYEARRERSSGGPNVRQDFADGWPAWHLLRFAIDARSFSREQALAVLLLVRSLGMAGSEELTRLPVSLRVASELNALRGPLLNGQDRLLALAADAAWRVAEDATQRVVHLEDPPDLDETEKAILAALRSRSTRRRWTLAALMTVARVSEESTISRAIARLRKLGYPIENRGGARGFYLEGPRQAKPYKKPRAKSTPKRR